MDGFIADLLAFLWWKHDNDKAATADAEEQAKQAQIVAARNPTAPRAWDSVVGEWTEK
jgi:hypothetical protein